MGNTSSIQRLNFEDIQDIIKNSDSYVLINTLSIDDQYCLIPTTIDFKQEEPLLNNLIVNNKEKPIVIYGKNTNDLSVYTKYDQLIGLGFKSIYIYSGGIFEWLCLQDIYGVELFPTTKKELDILKFKPISFFNKKKYYITND